MKVILETNRLLLRELDVNDAERFYQLNENPKVIQYTGNSAFASLAEAKDFLSNYQDYKLNGFGRWAVIDKQTEAFLGWCGLKFCEVENEVDIGFRFFEEHWNHGYATESAKACLEYGFEKLGLRRIVGRAMKENIASVKVLEKIGLQYERDMYFEGREAVMYVGEQ